MNIFASASRRYEFLITKYTTVWWLDICSAIESVYPAGVSDHPSIGLGRIRRLRFVQLRFHQVDPVCVEVLPYSASLRCFAGIVLGTKPVADATKMLKFRRLPNANKLGEQMFDKVSWVLQASGGELKVGAIVDATFIGVPSSTKNKERKRDAAIHQSSMEQQWHFGMDLPFGVDRQSGLTHHAVVTEANIHDRSSQPDLLHGNETRVHSDSAGVRQKDKIASNVPAAKDFTSAQVRNYMGEIDGDKRSRNHNKSRIRAWVEHVFGVVECLWRFNKACYLVLVKNAMRALMARVQVNLYLAREQLTSRMCLGELNLCQQARQLRGNSPRDRLKLEQEPASTAPNLRLF